MSPARTPQDLRARHAPVACARHAISQAAVREISAAALRLFGSAADRSKAVFDDAVEREAETRSELKL